MSQDEPSFELLSAEEIAKLLPAYSDISFLAKGGMAAVYKGLQTTLERPVAIKVLPREFGENESFRLRFIAEGKAMARLNHSNLVGIFDFGEVDGLLYLVMEFVDGQTLHHYSYGQAMDELMALDLCARVADGLAHAHGHGIMHRDIKPANVLLDAELNPKLGDFGLAEGEERAEGDDLVFGTPGYTPPEVMNNPASADEKSDIYAVGILLYQLLTTTIPQEPYQAPSQVVQSDNRIDTVLAQAIQPDPAHRPASAREFASQLREVYAQIKKSPRRKLATDAPISAKALKVATPPSSSAPTTQPSNTKAAQAAHRKRANPSPASGSSSSNFPLIRNLIIILALAGGVFAAWKAKGTKEEAVTTHNEKQEVEADRQQRQMEAKEIANSLPEQSVTSVTEAEEMPAKAEVAAVVENEPPIVEQKISDKGLAELRAALADGRRDQFPAGSIRQGSSYYLFVEEPLNWYHAIEFAEDHGAQLAITASEDEVRWLSEAIPSKAGDVDLWVAAGATGTTAWSWFDSSVAFELPIPPSTTKIAGLVSHLGVFKARHPSEKHPFFLQWNSEGESTGRRKNTLKDIAESISSEEPIWPSGARTFEGRHYLTIGRSLTYEEAETIALDAGGTLAVASTPLEASFLRDYSAESGLADLWIGGEKKNGSWQWATGEKWENAQWRTGSPQATAGATAITLNSEGWHNLHPFQEAPGFIIEWSQDSGKTIPTITRKPSDLSNLADLKTRATRYLQGQKEAANEQDLLSAANTLRRAYLSKIDELLVNTRAGKIDAKVGPLLQKVEQAGDNGEAFLSYLGVN